MARVVFRGNQCTWAVLEEISVLGARAMFGEKKMYTGYGQ